RDGLRLARTAHRRRHGPSGCGTRQGCAPITVRARESSPGQYPQPDAQGGTRGERVLSFSTSAATAACKPLICKEKVNVVLLAAGMGKRMRSALPKVLHELAGRPLLRHVVDVARSLGPRTIVVVYGHGGEAVREAVPGDDLRWVLQ